jgi:hypothetical protein
VRKNRKEHVDRLQRQAEQQPEEKVLTTDLATHAALLTIVRTDLLATLAILRHFELRPPVAHDSIHVHCENFLLTAALCAYLARASDVLKDMPKKLKTSSSPFPADHAQLMTSVRLARRSVYLHFAQLQTEWLAVKQGSEGLDLTVSFRVFPVHALLASLRDLTRLFLDQVMHLRTIADTKMSAQVFTSSNFTRRKVIINPRSQEWKGVQEAAGQLLKKQSEERQQKEAAEKRAAKRAERDAMSAEEKAAEEKRIELAKLDGERKRELARQAKAAKKSSKSSTTAAGVGLSSSSSSSSFSSSSFSSSSFSSSSFSSSSSSSSSFSSSSATSAAGAAALFCTETQQSVIGP